MKFQCLLSAAVILATAGGGTRAANLPLTDTEVSEPRAVTDGSWRYVVRRSTQEFACGPGSHSQLSCVTYEVTVENESPQALQCMVRVDITRPTDAGARTFESPALILPRTRPQVYGDTITSDSTLKITRLDCTARPPHLRLPKQAGCEYQMKGDPLADYYPADAIRSSLEGPVLISFLLTKEHGHASEIAVAESSLIPALDSAAKAFVSGQSFTTPCAGTRYDLRVRFSLRDYLATR